MGLEQLLNLFKNNSWTFLEKKDYLKYMRNQVKCVNEPITASKMWERILASSSLGRMFVWSTW